jgi:hypothetical protein
MFFGKKRRKADYAASRWHVHQIINKQGRTRIKRVLELLNKCLTIEIMERRIIERKSLQKVLRYFFTKDENGK